MSRTFRLSLWCWRRYVRAPAAQYPAPIEGRAGTMRQKPRSIHDTERRLSTVQR